MGPVIIIELWILLSKDTIFWPKILQEIVFGVATKSHLLELQLFNLGVALRDPRNFVWSLQSYMDPVTL